LANWEGKRLQDVTIDQAEQPFANGMIISRALGVPIGNALLIGGLKSQVPKYAGSVSSEAVIRNGALNLQSLTNSPIALRGLREAYAIAISRVNIFLVVVICVSVPTSLGMQWLNIKKVSIKREQQISDLKGQHELVETKTS